ncbi:hypothetical protein ACW2QC_01785 [Virgibacillus sp. FSP13]
MIKVRYKRWFINMMDIYGSTKWNPEKSVDIIISSNVLFSANRHQKLPPQKRVLLSYGKTLVIDLQRSEEELFADIHKNARYKINRAKKRDAINYHELISPSDKEIHAFIQFFDRFAKLKQIPKGNFGRLQSLRDKGALILSYITDEAGNPLCYHAYVKTAAYCSLLHSASARFENNAERNKIGRANRFLHWQDILSFKKMGFSWFDFGGLFLDEQEGAEHSINRFKKEFGGQVVDVDKKITPLTMLGKMVVFVFWLKMRKRPEFLRAKQLANRYTLENM